MTVRFEEHNDNTTPGGTDESTTTGGNKFSPRKIAKSAFTLTNFAIVIVVVTLAYFLLGL
jgi:hypothetical protein